MANWGNIVQLTSNGWSHYRALYVRLDKRMANRYMYLVSYTRDWTTNSVDNVSDFYHPDLDTGPSGRKHTLVASGSARLPFDLTFGAVWTIRTALPYSALSGVDFTGDGTIDFVPGTSRNQAGRDSAGTAFVLQKVNEWRAVRNLGPTRYLECWSSMRAFTDARDAGTPDEVWLTEHEPVIALLRGAQAG